MTDNQFQIILITAGKEEEAQKIATKLVSSRLVACVNIIPAINSIYRWQGKVCNDSELLLICKGKKENFKKIEKAVKELHSYDVPEIIALAIERGSQEYLSWLAQ